MWAWVYGYMGAWVYGCMGVWVCVLLPLPEWSFWFLFLVCTLLFWCIWTQSISMKYQYSKIIFTFYRMSNHSNEQISKIIKQMDLFAITMDPARLRSGIIKKIDKKFFFVYVYTVNSFLRFLQYKIFFGADEIYTDTLF